MPVMLLLLLLYAINTLDVYVWKSAASCGPALLTLENLLAERPRRDSWRQPSWPKLENRSKPFRDAVSPHFDTSILAQHNKDEVSRFRCPSGSSRPTCLGSVPTVVSANLAPCNRHAIRSH